MVGRRRARGVRSSACPSWQALAEAQAGAVSRRQLRELGLSEGAISALLDAGRWTGLLPGVYATFTGPVPALTHAWAAVLYASATAVEGGPAGVGEAALAGRTALWLHGVLDAPPEVVAVNVTERRRVRPQPGLAIRTLRDFTAALHPAALPPRLRLEPALLDVTATMTRVEPVIDLVLRATQRRLTTPTRLRAALAARTRHRWRRLILDLLDEAQDGVASPLELRWVRDVERRHRLPEADRNAPDPLRRNGSRRYRDLRYRRWGVVAELDGREAHPDHERFRDRARDNEVTVDGEVALRYGLREVAGDPCGCAAQLADVLRLRGWTGAPRPCGPGCPVR